MTLLNNVTFCIDHFATNFPSEYTFKNTFAMASIPFFNCVISGRVF